MSAPNRATHRPPERQRSAYPPRVEDLVPQARGLAEQLGQIPSRNRIMEEFRVGAPKARAIREALVGSEFGPDCAPERTRLRVVGQPHPAEPEPGTDPGPDTVAETDAPAAEPAPTTPPTGPASSSVPAEPAPVPGPIPQPSHTPKRDVEAAQTSTPADPGTNPNTTAGPNPAEDPGPPVARWPVLLLAAPAFVAIWSGWVGLGALTGFGVVHPLPGIWDSFTLNTAITLPIGVETYAAYALRIWLASHVPARARRFAKWSALGSLLLGMLGQIAYHLMKAAGYTAAPWPITTAVSCLPVAVLGMGAALAHLMHTDETRKEEN
ncbi:hypothetical protein GCM10012275_02540 [Longimycelium tulufanense]|uniref:Uncharacterized protein n=1 Tax=Longimycelium tulufanense TaxID=907463 RepID=A0A8J3FS78_9PSEU|nr:ABC transporter permease [Longimycelium tulufanense]GGM34772.1 hypothetical protein GCM10012275_02540 [Longimycelium tulufanense]